MPSSFRIFMKENSGKNGLYLKLAGYFDGNSADKLLEALKNYSLNFNQIFIDAKDLKILHPIAREVPAADFGGFKRLFGNIVFTGENFWNNSYLYQWLLWHQAG